MNVKSTAEKVRDALLKDLTSRKGLRHQWESIDDDIQKEIKEEWHKLIEVELVKAL